MTKKKKNILHTRYCSFLFQFLYIYTTKKKKMESRDLQILILPKFSYQNMRLEYIESCVFFIFHI